MAAQAFPYMTETEIPQQAQRTSKPRMVTTSERNRTLFEQQQARRRGPTLEIPFTKHLDNSRLVKSSDRTRVREMRGFAMATFAMFFLLAVYVVQHFNAIENGYHVEAQKQQLSQLLEDNRHLRLTQAQLTDPSRIGAVAEQLGMTPPQPGQVVQQDGTFAAGVGAPVLAQAVEPSRSK